MPEPPTAASRVVGAVVLNSDGRAFVQRRAATRQLFPDCWDIIGGHVEPAETLATALAREVEEETGWRLDRIVCQLAHFDWTGPDGRMRTESDYLVRVHGDLAAPRLESDKHCEYRWIGPDELDLLTEHREPGDHHLRDVVAQALRSADRQSGAGAPTASGKVATPTVEGCDHAAGAS